MYTNKYNSPDQVSGDIQITLDPEVTVGSFVVVLDSSGGSRYHVVKVIDITDQNVMVNCYDIKSRQPRGAKLVSLYHRLGTKQMVQHDLQTYDRNRTKMTEDIRTDDILIILINLGLADTMRLNAQAKRLLNQTKYRYNIMGRTWWHSHGSSIPRGNKP